MAVVDGIDRRRHARHLLLTEIGEHGQVRLCATRVHIPPHADARAAHVARDYLERAGLQVAPEPVPTSPARPIPVPDTAAIRTLAGRPDLEEAAAALAGAFAAVEAIKDALGLPARGALPRDLQLGGEAPA